MEWKGKWEGSKKQEKERYTTPIEDRMRIIQEIVPGKQITLAHIIANPYDALYAHVFNEANKERAYAALGIVMMSPSESVIIAGDIALKTAEIEIKLIDYKNGTLMINGKISEVSVAIENIVAYCEEALEFTVATITKS